MDRKKFMVEFGQLLCAKQAPVERITFEVYWEDLRALPFLEETLKECRGRIWYRDFEKTVPRFPESAEMKKVHDELANRKDAKNFHQVSAPKEAVCDYLKNKQKGYCQVLGKFCQDCMRVVGLNCAEVWDYCEKNNIEIPLGYKNTTKDIEGFELVAKSILGEGFYTIKKVTPVGNIGKLLGS